ncbi:FxSxx-COOH system tetratricopeptide repeat protein [Streptomyces sp. NPDC006372]|uniref:FxSxx-COOH system tetratricopeptide repeat protein n=1 Tax=Streptomyces sp. NPDC006372 TaxID=3155599 RepID=UPI0033BF18E5
MPDTHAADRPGRFALFCSTAENLGVSTTVRNVADLLAASNRSVLIVDGRASGTPVPERPTRTSANTASSESAGVRDPDASVPEPVSGRIFSVARRDAAGLLALASDTVVLRYDHVLVEAPLPDAPGAPPEGRLGSLADSLVLCFAMTAWSIDGAAALAEQLSGGRSDRPVRLLALGLKSNVESHDRLRGARERVRRKFGPLARTGRTSEVAFLEIPYNPLYLDTRQLAVESEPEGSVTGLRPYYERLADWLRNRRPVPLGRVTIVHSQRHAPWAAWLEDQFRRGGIRTELRAQDAYSGDRPAPGTALLFLSPADMDHGALAQLAALSHPDVRIVLADEPFPDPGAAHHERIDLRGTDEDEAARRLYSGLGLGAPPPADSTPGARFPRLPAVTNVAPRYSGFVGRDEVLGSLLEELHTAGRDRTPLVVHAASGWGKSETVRELCHRFGSAYDVVWWVRSWEIPRARRGLNRLAGRLDLTTTGDGASPALFEHLSRTDTQSWLLVYDGADTPDDLRELLPTPHARGHVLITSRTAPATPGMAAFALPPMAPAECRAVLGERLPEIDEEQAQRVGQVLGFVPLAVRIAALCLAERAAAHRRDDGMGDPAAARAAVQHLLADYRTAQEAQLERTDAAPPVTVMVQVARQTALHTPGAAAWRAESRTSDALGWLLNAASLLTGRGMGLELLRSRRILSELARDDTTARHPDGTPAHDSPADLRLPDEHMVSVALWSLSRVGLLEVDFDRSDQPLGQHHAVRDAVRAGMEPAERAHIEGVLRGTLAEFTPDENRGLSADWAREVYSLRLWEDDRPAVRRSLLRHLNALSQRGETADLARLLDISDRARTAWCPEGDDPSPEYLRLLNLTARAHRLDGAYEQARQLSEQALRGHRRLLGPLHPRTLLSADSYGAVLRSLGRFSDALFQARPVLEGLTLLLGPQHPATVQAEHNLAFTEALSGRAPDALARLLARFRYRQAVGGEDDPAVWRFADLLAWVYRTLGRDAESQDLLRQWLHRHGDAGTGTRLRIELGLAVSERRITYNSARSHETVYGYEKALERDRRLLAEYTSRFGADHLDTVRCRFSLAADLHALGKHDEAGHEARRCGRVLENTLGPWHPYAGLAGVRLGVYLRATGAVEEAEAVGRAALNLLEDRLGDSHAWVSAAENSLAATLAASGRVEEAAGLAERALRRLRDLDMGHRPDGRRVGAHHARLASRTTTAPARDFDIDLELPGI